jgi:hypothetical protein
MIDQTINGIPVIDLKHYLEDEKILRREAAQAVFRSLLTYSAVIVKDPRVTPEDFSGCQDLLRKYFNQPRSALLPDVHPEFHHQVGLSLEYAEGWRHSLLERAAGLPTEHQPTLRMKSEDELLLVERFPEIRARRAQSVKTYAGWL